MDYEKEIKKLQARVLDLESIVYDKMGCADCAWMGYRLTGVELNGTYYPQCPVCGSQNLHYAE